MVRVLITGANGFLGEKIVAHLKIIPSFNITALVSPQHPKTNCGSSVALDLTDEVALQKIISSARPDIIIHAAGRVTGSVAQLFRDNTVATITLANAVQSQDFPVRLLALGSAAEYGRPSACERINEAHPCRPESVYGHSKLAATNYLMSCAERRQLSVTVLRVFNLIGVVNSPNQVIGAYIGRAIAKYDDPAPRVITTGRLDAIRDFVAVRDLLVLIEHLASTPLSARILNVCSGTGHEVRALIEHLNRLSGNHFQLKELGAAPLPGDVDSVIGDPSLLERLAPWSPSDIHYELSTAWRLAMESRRHDKL